MKNVIFVALFLFACREGEVKSKIEYCHKMIISDGLPIQFWVDGCETFNQKNVQGINKVCFCQPFECDDDIKLQLTDDAGKNIILSLLDESGNNLYSKQFNETSLSQNIIDAHFTTDLDGLSNNAFSDVNRFYDWSWDSGDGGRLTSNVNKTGSQTNVTKLITKNVSGNIGLNTITTTWALADTPITTNVFNLNLYLIKSNVIVQTIQIDSKTGGTSSFKRAINNFQFTSTVAYDQIGMGVTFSGVSGLVVYLYNFTVNNIQPSIYNIEIIPSNIGICDEKVTFNISTGGAFSAIYTTPVSSWSNIAGSGPDWSAVSDGFSVLCSLSTPSDVLSIPVTIPVIGLVNIDIEIDGNLLAMSSHAVIGFYKSGSLVSNTQTLNTQFFTNTGTLSFTLTSPADEIRVVETLFSASASPIIYKVKDNLRVYSSGTLNAYSDCIDIRTTWNETILIDYSNTRNFAGIDTQDISPDLSFSLRIFAVFFEEEFPQQQESLDISNNQEISLNSQLKVQRLLNTGLMPFYMHKKTILALMHQSVMIDGNFWVKSDAYEKIQGNKRNPLKQYKCLLTQQDDIIRNIL